VQQDHTNGGGTMITQAEETQGVRATVTPVIRRYVELMKLRIAAMIALTAVTGYAAMADPVRPGAVVALTVAMILGAAASAVVNHVCDRDIDRMMRRTRNRPLATGTITVANALILATVLMALALGLAATAFNVWVALNLFLGAFVYAVLYTIWLKRRTWLNIVVGGAAGSFAMLAGAAVVQPTDWLLPLLLAGTLFLWTPSHFWSLAILLTEDYRAAGIPMLPVIIGEARTARWILANSIALVASSLLPWMFGLLGTGYAIAAAALGTVLLGFNLLLVAHPTRKWAGWSFAASMPYLLGLFAAVIFGR
jgi:heme o synthase